MKRIIKKNSTKSERILGEILKELHIPFKHRWIVAGREIDFIVGNLAIEIDGHEQDAYKNNMLVQEGYIPIHLDNVEILSDRGKIKNDIKLLWQTQHSGGR